MLGLRCVLGMSVIGMFIGCCGNTFSPINGTWRGTDQVGTPAALHIDTNHRVTFVSDLLYQDTHWYTGTLNRVDNRFKVYVKRKRNDVKPVNLWERDGLLLYGEILNGCIIVRIPRPDYSVKFRLLKSYETNGFVEAK
jgi:hypothetical protein